MKRILIVFTIGLLMCSFALAQDTTDQNTIDQAILDQAAALELADIAEGFTPVDRNTIKSIKRVLKDGFTAALKKCFDDNKCRESNYGLNALLTFDKKPMNGYDIYRIYCIVIDNWDTTKSGLLWAELQYYPDFDGLLLTAYETNLPAPDSDGSDGL